MAGEHNMIITTHVTHQLGHGSHGDDVINGSLLLARQQLTACNIMAAQHNDCGVLTGSG